MVKYLNAMVVFEEIPREITLAVNITNCPCRCKGCHSKFLWEDVGKELTSDELKRLIDKNKGITTVCFMGGDREPSEINKLAKDISNDTSYKYIKCAWYSGRDEISNEIDLKFFKYIKIGHYDEKLGGLNKKTTNQKLYKVNENNELEDITYLFKQR